MPEREIPEPSHLPRHMKQAAICYEFEIKPLVLDGIPLSLGGINAIIDEHNNTKVAFKDEEFSLVNLFSLALARTLTTHKPEDTQCFNAILEVCKTKSLL